MKVISKKTIFAASLRIFIVAVLLLITGCSSLAADRTAGKKVPAVSEKKSIRAAVPHKVAVRPECPRKLLVFSRSWGYKHSAIEYGKEALRMMAEKTGAFDVVISDDLKYFEPENIKQFDAIFFNNTNQEIFLPEDFDKLAPDEQTEHRKIDERLKKSFVDFLAGGKGLAVLHSGVACFREWPEYGNIIGARFDNHPWNHDSTVTLKIDDPDHPLTRAFKKPAFVITDEIYQLKGPYSREKLRVLVSVDTCRTDMDVKGIHRTDNDFAISWVKSYGRGRVFYCALGHNHDIFWNPVVLGHILDGIQFVLGDLEADTTPSAQLLPASSRGTGQH